jgi:hypothetical protein
MSFRARAAVFVRIGGAEGAGHLGWAFDVNDSLTDAGAVENPGGCPVALPGETGFWTSETADPIAAMQDPQHAYDMLKYVDVAAPDLTTTFKTLLWIKQQPYCVFGRNCMDDVYDVLRAYGVPNLPPPVDHWAPNAWFAAFRAPENAVAGFTWSSSPPTATLAPTTTTLLELHAATATPTSEAPEWRVQGTHAWYDLQVQKASASEYHALKAMAARVPLQPPW